MTQQELIAQLEALREENAKLKSKATSKAVQGLSFRVSAKGAVSVYGLGRFPVTLYGEQWVRLLDRKEDILSYIEENKGELKTKAESKAAA